MLKGKPIISRQISAKDVFLSHDNAYLQSQLCKQHQMLVYLVRISQPPPLPGNTYRHASPIIVTVKQTECFSLMLLESDLNLHPQSIIGKQLKFTKNNIVHASIDSKCLSSLVNEHNPYYHQDHTHIHK